MKRTICILIMSLLFAGCGQSTGSGEDNINGEEDKISVYTTIYPIEYILDELLGEKGDVKTILSPTSDPHSYEPTQKQLIEISESDMFFYLGLGLETMANKIEETVANENVETVEIGKYLDLDKVTMYPSSHDHEEEEDHDHEEDEDHEEHINHHIWMDPMNMVEMGKVVKEKIVEKYPELEEFVEENYLDFENKMIQLDKTYYDAFSDTRRNIFIVSHDSFAHLAKYGLTSVPVKDEMNSKEPTQQELLEIINIARENDISTVYYERNIPCPSLDIVKNELDASSEVLDNLSVRTNEEIEQNVDYYDKAIANIGLLIKGLN